MDQAKSIITNLVDAITKFVDQYIAMVKELVEKLQNLGTAKKDEDTTK